MGNTNGKQSDLSAGHPAQRAADHAGVLPERVPELGRDGRFRPGPAIELSRGHLPVTPDPFRRFP